MYDARDSAAQLEALREVFDIPGFTPTWRDNATMVSLLRANERIEDALPFAKKCVTEIPGEDPQRNTLLHDYAVCLFEDGGVKGSLDATLEINHADKTHRTAKIGMLDKISVCCDEADVKARNALKVTALRELMSTASEERQGKLAWELSAALCRQDSFEEGVKFYKQAMASGIDEPGLNEAFKVAVFQAAFQKADFD